MILNAMLLLLLLFQLDFLEYSKIVDSRGIGKIKLLSFEFDPIGPEDNSLIIYYWHYITQEERDNCNSDFSGDSFILLREICLKSFFYFIGGFAVSSFIITIMDHRFM